MTMIITLFLWFKILFNKSLNFVTCMSLGLWSTSQQCAYAIQNNDYFNMRKTSKFCWFSEKHCVWDNAFLHNRNLSPKIKKWIEEPCRQKTGKQCVSTSTLITLHTTPRSRFQGKIYTKCMIYAKYIYILHR